MTDHIRAFKVFQEAVMLFSVKINSEIQVSGNYFVTKQNCLQSQKSTKKYSYFQVQ